MRPGPKPRDPMTRFLSKVEVMPNGCHEWRAATNLKGYGTFYVSAERPRVLAHTWAWEQAHGRRLREGLEILHSCDNPPCVRLDHLSEGTHARNMREYGDRRELCMNNLHPRTPENLMHVGTRVVCRPCREAHVRRQIARRSDRRRQRREEE